jgi:hypothetical protein
MWWAACHLCTLKQLYRPIMSSTNNLLAHKDNYKCTLNHDTWLRNVGSSQMVLSPSIVIAPSWDIEFGRTVTRKKNTRTVKISINSWRRCFSGFWHHVHLSMSLHETDEPTWRQNPEEHHHHPHCREYLKSHTVLIVDLKSR